MTEHTSPSMAASNVKGSAPVLLVRDVERAVAHYRDVLGFTAVVVDGNPPRFALLRRGGGAVQLVRADDPSVIRPNWTVQNKVNNVYFWVEDAAVLYDEYRRSGATIDWELYDTPWGMREFGIQDLDGYDIAFGQVLV